MAVQFPQRPLIAGCSLLGNSDGQLAGGTCFRFIPVMKFRSAAGEPGHTPRKPALPAENMIISPVHVSVQRTTSSICCDTLAQPKIRPEEPAVVEVRNTQHLSSDTVLRAMEWTFDSIAAEQQRIRALRKRRKQQFRKHFEGYTEQREALVGELESPRNFKDGQQHIKQLYQYENHLHVPRCGGGVPPSLSPSVASSARRDRGAGWHDVDLAEPSPDREGEREGDGGGEVSSSVDSKLNAEQLSHPHFVHHPSAGRHERHIRPPPPLIEKEQVGIIYATNRAQAVQRQDAPPATGLGKVMETVREVQRRRVCNDYERQVDAERQRSLEEAERQKRFEARTREARHQAMVATQLREQRRELLQMAVQRAEDVRRQRAEQIIHEQDRLLQLRLEMKNKPARKPLVTVNYAV